MSTGRAASRAVAAWAALLAATTPAAEPDDTLSDSTLLDQIQERAVRFFRERAHPRTGLITDRARNTGTDTYDVSSLAANGYGLAALPVAVERGWMTREDALAQALRLLRFLRREMPHKHGWMYHFVDCSTAERVWKCEVSTIDTGLLVLGALVCGQYFRGEAQRLANGLYDRLDWQWALTNGGRKSGKRLITHGWRPERGFIRFDWDSYSEGILLYLLGLGARQPIPRESWSAWPRTPFRYGGLQTFTGGPIFLHQMPHGFYDLRGRRDSLGHDYWKAAENAMRMHRQFCQDRAGRRKTYAAGFWGLTACDGPNGYRAYGIPKPEDGTVSPAAMIATITFLPREAKAAIRALRAMPGEPIWGRYGFSDAFNLDRDWFDPDVIGIDLGMALVAIENHRSGLIWKLMSSHPSTGRSFSAAGLKRR